MRVPILPNALSSLGKSSLRSLRVRLSSLTQSQIHAPDTAPPRKQGNSSPESSSQR